MAGQSRDRKQGAFGPGYYEAVVYSRYPVGHPSYHAPTSLGQVLALSDVQREFMSDVVKNHKGINPLYHITCRAFGHSYSLDNGGTEYITVSGTPLACTPAENMVRVLSEVSTTTLDTAAQGAVAQFNTEIPEIISIANFLYELKDLRELLPRIQGMQTLSNGFLSYNFGWKPLISDLKKLATVIHDVIARLEYLRQTNHKWVKLHYRYQLQPSQYPTINLSGGPITAPYLSPLSAELVNYAGVFRAHSWIKRDLTGLDGDIGMLKAFLYALGLTNPAKIVWNAIPYSFVVDWFVRVSDHFQGFQVYGGSIKTKNTTWSLSESGVIRCYKNGVIFNGVSYQANPGDIAFRRYRRGAGLPFTVGSISFQQLTPTQQLLGAALINQGLRR